MLQNMARSFVIYIIGIITLTLGISLTIQSQLGASPFDALLVGLYRSFGLTIGSWEIIVGFTIVMLNAIAIKAKPEWFAMLTSFITGLGIDSWLFIQGSWLTPDNWLEQSAILLFGIIFSGIGIAIYLESSFAPNPMDRSMVIITDKTGLSFGISRAIISIALVIVALLFQGDVGIGTLVNALCTGVIIQALRPYVVLVKQKYVVPSMKAS
ncbi:YczE/YyaS/YitT family protein [Gracilibacillus thailandensis]|uniref:YitT family protein n=1 Tax=Gracilibacillus thailandensis TaxID=563735 RepID=A0A6N7R4S4_9BACI|nr:YitT family protein [Gracilibacillus thailandensis]MRI68206.1 YitT family protein [Gracilibacillus thailandensis]